MSSHTEGNAVAELLLHLDAQRDSALMLIEKHNALLASFLGLRGTRAGPALIQHARAAPTAPVSLPAAVAGKKGNVVSLFDYKNQTGHNATTQPPTTPYLVFNENDAESLRLWGKTIEELLATYGADDALAINRKQMADTIFLSAARNGIFYHKSHSGVLFAVCFVGADEHYAATLNELKIYADANELQINLMAQEARVSDLKACGFSTTPLGIWQRIEPLSAFTLEGQAMRRLRYMVSKYAKTGVCKTLEYAPGTSPDTDKAICEVIDQWVELKGKTPPFVIDVKKQIMRGGISQDHRFFLTYRNDAIDNVMVFSRDNFNNGYLMDLEFYAKDLPLGSTEFALNEIIECFKKEGRQVVSLGLTMGTELFEHENCSKDVFVFFEQLKKANFLNGDANAQYKNKYRPATTVMHLARPSGCGKKKLNDLMLLLGSA